jgi:hypothetical protein
LIGHQAALNPRQLDASADEQAVAVALQLLGTARSMTVRLS